MEIVRFLVVAVVFVLIAWQYRSLPQNTGKLSLRYAGLSPKFRASYRARLERELAGYRAALADPPTYQAQALHLVALMVLSGVMTLLALALFIASRLVQMRGIPAVVAPYFPSVDILLVVFFLFSIVGFRFAVFRSWIFLHKERNLGRLQRSIGVLGGTP